MNVTGKSILLYDGIPVSILAIFNYKRYSVICYLCIVCSIYKLCINLPFSACMILYYTHFTVYIRNMSYY